MTKETKFQNLKYLLKLSKENGSLILIYFLQILVEYREGEKDLDKLEKKIFSTTRIINI